MKWSPFNLTINFLMQYAKNKVSLCCASTGTTNVLCDIGVADTKSCENKRK